MLKSKGNRLSRIERKAFRERFVNDFLDIVTLHCLHHFGSPKTAQEILIYCKSSFGIEVRDDSIYASLFALEKKKLITGKSIKVGNFTNRYYKLSKKGIYVIQLLEMYKQEVMALNSAEKAS